MDFKKGYVAMLLALLIAGPVLAGDAILITSEDSAGAFRTLNANDDLTNEVMASGNLAGVTAIVAAEVDSSSTGAELIVARQGVLEIRSGVDYSLIKSRGGFDEIFSIAVGDLDAANSGPEIAIGSANVGPSGRLTIVDPDSADLADLAFLGLGLGVQGVAIGDVNAVNPGNELIFCWEWSEDNFQMAVASYAAGAISGNITFQNGPSFCRSLVVADFDPNNANDEIIAGFNDGAIYTFDGDMDAGNTLIQARGGFVEITALAVGELVDTSNGLEVVIASADSGGAVRVTGGTDILSDLAGRVGFVSVPAMTIGDVILSDAGNELIVTDTVAGALRIIEPADPALADLTLRAGFTDITGVVTYDVPSVPVELSNFTVD